MALRPRLDRRRVRRKHHGLHRGQLLGDFRQPRVDLLGHIQQSEQLRQIHVSLLVDVAGVHVHQRNPRKWNARPGEHIGLDRQVVEMHVLRSRGRLHFDQAPRGGISCSCHTLQDIDPHQHAVMQKGPFEDRGSRAFP